MRRSVLILNLILVVVAVLLGYRLRVEWKNHQSRVKWAYQAASAEHIAGFAAAQTAAGLENWSDIVARNVFFPDRSSLTASAAGGAPPPEPILFGTMNLGSGPIALMSEGPDRGFRRVRLGEPIGGYKLVEVAGQKVILEWAGGQIKLDAAESASRVRSEAGTTPSPAPAPPRSATVGPSGVAVVSPSTSATAPGSGAGGMSSPILDRFPQLRGIASREQIADLEREPPGTIRNGKIKRVDAWPFGVHVWWEDVKPGEEKK